MVSRARRRDTASSLFYSSSQSQPVFELKKSLGPWSSVRTLACLYTASASTKDMLFEHEQNYGLSMDAQVHRMLLEYDRNYGLGMDALVHRMPSEHNQKYGLGMDALVVSCSCNTNGILVWAWMLWVTVCPWNTTRSMVWAWMLWWSIALVTRTELWFVPGWSGSDMASLMRSKRIVGSYTPRRKGGCLSGDWYLGLAKSTESAEKTTPS